jgi:hypothetical protein
MELDVKIAGEGLQNLGLYARRSGPLSGEGSSPCHTYCDTESRFFRSHPKDRPIQSPLTIDRHGDYYYYYIYLHDLDKRHTNYIHMWLHISTRMQRTCSNPDPHGNLKCICELKLITVKVIFFLDLVQHFQKRDETWKSRQYRPLCVFSGN